MDSFLKLLGAIVFASAIVILIAVMLTLPVMWLTNYLFTPAVIYALFGVAKLTFWKALALSTLCSFLFKNYQSNKKGS